MGRKCEINKYVLGSYVGGIGIECYGICVF